MISQRLRSLGRAALLPALVAVPVAGGALASTTQLASAAPLASCGSTSSGGGNSITININTSTGCNDSAGQAGNPSTGYVTFGFPAGDAAAKVLFATEGNDRGGGHPYYTGSYFVQLTNCTGGTAISYSATYDVTNPSSNQYPTPPANGSGTTFGQSNSPFAITASSTGGSVTCQYSLAAPISASTDTSAASYTVDVFAWYTGLQNTQVRTQSVKPPDACTGSGCTPPTGTDTPELGSGELLATGLLPIAGILLYRRSRRRTS